MEEIMEILKKLPDHEVLALNEGRLSGELEEALKREVHLRKLYD